jgi:iron complex outermembrane receptor protein
VCSVVLAAGLAAEGAAQDTGEPAPEAPLESPPPDAPEETPAPDVADEPAAPDPLDEAPAPEAPAEPTGAADAALATEAEAPAAAAQSEELVITSQRYEQSLQDAPVAVTAFSTTSMDRRGVTNLQDVGKFTPNLELHSTNRPAGGSSAYAAYIRGIGTGDFQFPTDPGVGLYIDDVYMARTMGGLLSIDLDIERIEVIRGPQGTLFGRNTIGGAFNVTTTPAETQGEDFGTVMLRVGTYGRRDFGVAVNGPLLQDRIGAKLAVAVLHSDGFGERILTGEKTNDEGRLVVRGGLRFTPVEDLDLRLNGDYSKQDQNPPNGQFIALMPMPPPPTVDKIARFNTIAAPALNPGLGLEDDDVYNGEWISRGPYDNYALQNVYDRYDLGGGSFVIGYQVVDPLHIKSITAARALRSEISVDGDQTPYPLQTSATDLDQAQYSQELQFSGLIAERLRYMVGFYAFREIGDSTVDTQSFSGIFENVPMGMGMPPDAADTFTSFELTATSLAAFTQLTLMIVDGLHLTAGARINRDEKDYTYSVLRPQTGMFQVPRSNAVASWNSFTPKLGVDYSPIDGLMVYASYAQGFKSGGFGPSNSMSIPTPIYDPETVTAYELGVKTEWLDRRLTAGAAGFYNDYRDIQLTVQTVDPVTNANVRTTQNAGESRIKGFEVELGALPVDALALNLGVGYVDATFHTLSMQAIAVGFQVGDRLPQVPDWSANAGAQYTFETGIGDITLRGDLAYKGDHFLTAADPSSFQEGFFLYNARLAYVPANVRELELSIQGINLSDEVYYIYHATLAPTGQEIGLAAQPRLIYAMAKYSY